MKLVWGLVVALVVILMTGCASTITSGRVVEKKYEESRTWTTMMPIKIGRITTYMPQFHYDDEDWILIIEGVNNNDTVVQATLYVDKDTWEEVQVGDYYESQPEQSEDPDETKRMK